jgi:hypothetical protein
MLNGDDAMAFADPFHAVCLNDDSSIYRDFYVVSTLPQGSVRVCPNAGAGTPRLLKISHQIVGSGVKQRARHLVRFEADALDGDGNPDPSVGIAAAYAVFDIPFKGVTDENAQYLCKQLAGMLRGKSGADIDFDADACFGGLMLGFS